MTDHRFDRRRFLRCSAASAGLALAAPLAAAEGAKSAPANSGFKIGGVDWELKGANDPGAFAVAARLGLDGVQVDLGDVLPMRVPERQAKFIKAAAEHKVEIASLALGLFYNMSLAKDKRVPALLDAAVDIAVAMKQRVVLVSCFGDSDIAQPPAYIDALVGRMKEHAPKAEKAGVVLGLEGECSVEHYKKILERIDSPAVKAYFDTGHAHRPGRDIVAEIELLKDRICEFHAKDFGNILFGQGKVDFAAVRRGMDAIGYRGWIQIEQWNEISGPKPLGFDETHRRNLKFLRGLFPR